MVTKQEELRAAYVAGKVSLFSNLDPKALELFSAEAMERYPDPPKTLRVLETEGHNALIRWNPKAAIYQWAPSLHNTWRTLRFQVTVPFNVTPVRCERLLDLFHKPFIEDLQDDAGRDGSSPK